MEVPELAAFTGLILTFAVRYIRRAGQLVVRERGSNKDRARIYTSPRTVRSVDQNRTASTRTRYDIVYSARYICLIMYQ